MYEVWDENERRMGDMRRGGATDLYSFTIIPSVARFCYINIYTILYIEVF